MTSPLFEVDRSLPLTALSLVVLAGSELDPIGKEGLTRLTLRLMRRTPRGRNADETNELIEGLGATLTGDVGRTTTSLNGVVLSENLAAFTELIEEVWSHADLNDKEFAQLKSECLAEWRESLDNDRSLAFRNLDRHLYGVGPTLGRPAAGTWASLSRIERSDLVEHRAVLTDGRAPILAASGDFTPSFLENFASKLARSGAPAASAEVPTPTVPSGRRLYFIDKPERTQSQIALGASGSHPADPDHYALIVGNTIFGGTFTARLSQEVRVKRGWSYGAYSYLSLERNRGTFSLWTFPEAGDTLACIQLVLGMIESWVGKGVSEAEVRRAKTYLKRSHVFSIDTASKRVQQELDVRLHGWPEDYYSSYLEKIAAVTAEDVSRAIRARINPQNLCLAVVGTASNLFASLEKELPGLTHAEIVPFDRPD
jgi:zinc protease